MAKWMKSQLFEYFEQLLPMGKRASKPLYFHPRSHFPLTCVAGDPLSDHNL